jgi:hypothetical protein
MISAVSRAKDKTVENLTTLSNSRYAADRAFRAFVCKEMKADINAAVGRKA